MPLVALVDGSNYLYRAFFAIPALTNSKGFPTNAIYGFTNMLLKLLREINPDYVAVVFDVKGPTTRHEEFTDYKATRKPMPDDLSPQIPFIKEIIRGFSIPVLEKQGTEADDIIGALADEATKRGWRTVIVSGDKDLLQLIDENVTMVDTMKDKTYDVAAVKERFGVGPDKVVEILGLMGDTSDNIPGVPGVGPKTAQRLIEEYGSLEAVIANADNLRNVKLRESFKKYAEQARLSRQLALIRKDVQIDFDLKNAARREPDGDLLTKLFGEFEFSTLLQELKKESPAPPKDCFVIQSAQELTELCEDLRKCHNFAFEFIRETNEPSKTAGIALSVEEKVFYIPTAHTNLNEHLNLRQVINALDPVLSDKKIKKYSHDLKTMLVSQNDLRVEAADDTALMAYLLNPARHSYELAEIAWEYLHEQLPAAQDITGGKNNPLDEADMNQVAAYGSGRAAAIFKLGKTLAGKLKEVQADELYTKVEMPLLHVLASMEKKGVLIDADILNKMSNELGQLLSLSEEKIYKLAGEKFNINSPKQLQVILFEKLKLPTGRKTKEGYSTDVEVLSYLAQSHELPAEILSYRSLAKLKSTYVDALPALIDEHSGRIHTSYNQMATATGRLSSSNPNLQNIPIRTLEGKRIRQAFIAAPEYVLISADYSQIELRVLAHLSEDETLIDAFYSDEDIHARTAADVFGVFPQMVNADMRRQAKVINFGILYGMSAFGLAKELGVAQKTAQAYIDSYLERYKKVREYLDNILEGAKRDGYVCTLLNRRRYLPELKSKIPSVRQFAERMAINTPIQGTAADLIKIAMVNIAHLLETKSMNTRLIVQVHDELVLEAPKQEKEEAMKLVKKEMEEAIKLKVPLKVEIASGRSWDEAH